MREIDKEKSVMGKASKTINFDKIVLEKLEYKAKKMNTTVSNIVNMVCRQIVMTDVKWHQVMAKHHYLQMQEHRYMAEQSAIVVETKKELGESILNI